MGIEVCDLRRKFQMLKAYGFIDSLEDIASKVGRAEKTLWGWADGTATTEPNQIPSRNFEIFQSVFAETLRRKISPERAVELLLAPASYLENELRHSQTTSFMALIEEEADTFALNLILEEPVERGLIETQLDRKPKGQIHSVQQGKWFRLLLEQDMAVYNIVVLQNGAGLWGPVPWSIESKTGHVHLPGIEPEGRPAYMRELNALGKNMFVVIATKEPMPSWVMDVVAERQTFDSASRSALVNCYCQQEKSARKLFAVSIDIY